MLESPTLEQAESLVALGPLHPDSNLGAADDAELVAFSRLGLQAGVRAVVVDGTTVHEKGASEGQELGLGARPWRRRAAHARGRRHRGGAGLRPDRLRLAATDEQFATIAKFRAARRLWARMAQWATYRTPARGSTR